MTVDELLADIEAESALAEDLLTLVKLGRSVVDRLEAREATGRQVPVEPAVVARMVTHWRALGADPPES
jgi:hypothetical protein